MGRNTRLLPEPLEKSRNKIGLRTQMKKKILSIYSEEATLQSHVSFCRLTQALTRYRRKTKPGRGAYGPDSNTYTPTLNLTLNYGSARALNLSFLPPSTASALCLHSSVLPVFLFHDFQCFAVVSFSCVRLTANSRFLSLTPFYRQHRLSL